MTKVGDLFDVKYGVNLELNKLVLDAAGINFVSRTAKNNGVSAIVAKLDVEPIEAGVLTVAGGGSVLETFLQPKPFYSGRDLYYLKQKVEMTDAVKLYYCACIRANRYRYNYGRQANRTLKDILIPHPSQIPAWVNQANVVMYDGIDAPSSNLTFAALSSILEWKPFQFQELFDVERGKGPRRKDLDGSGDVPFISSSDSNNGLTAMLAIHMGKTIGVNRNGSVGEAFYQPVPFCSTEDVHIFSPKTEWSRKMNPYIGLFLTTLIRMEKYRFNYGRKWGIERMKQSVIKLPVNKQGRPDWSFMENYIKTLPFSSQL
jgi:Type I restriction modification DNA specificity domain